MNRLFHGRTTLAALLTALLMALALPAAGQGLGGLFGGGSGDQVLPVEQAFPVSVSQPAADQLEVHVDVHDGYYLYRQSVAVLVDGERLDADRLDLPRGVVREDEFFGRQLVWVEPETLTAALPAAVEGSTPVTIYLQGCSESGVCYPPYRVETTAAGGATDYAINPTAPTLVEDAVDGQDFPTARADDSVRTPAGPVGEAGRLERLLTEATLPAILGGFFLAGLLLAFTACLYPMIPILSGLIAGDPHRSGSLRAFGLSLVYVQATAITYALAGVAAGLTGAAVQADLQSPWVLGSFAALLVILALGMFGVYELRMPAGLQTRLTQLSNRQKGGTLVGVALMGMLSALIVGACSGPALIAALVFIGTTGDAWLGGLALFTLANGMGLPLLLIGTAAGRWLPRSGPWMQVVRGLFGIGFLAVALWMLERFLLGPITLGLWGVLLIGAGVWLGALDRLEAGINPLQRLGKTLGLVVLLWGGFSLLGAATGGNDVLRPLAGANLTGTAQEESRELAFLDIDSPADLDRAMADARAAGRPVMVDVYADWCVYCIQLERRTLTDPQVHEAVADAMLLRADVTAMNEDHRALLRRLEVYLPPAIIFYDVDGQENRDVRVVGFVDAEEFVQRARFGLGGG